MTEQPVMDPALSRRIDSLCEEGLEFWHRFDAEVRQDSWHPFVAADYDRVRSALLSLRRPGRPFLEWGSATGVITIMADLMGFDSCGIELDPSLVEVARGLAVGACSNARFAEGSFVPTGWVWKPRGGSDRRVGTIGRGRSGYLELGRSLADFNIVYAFPWTGEGPMMLDLMRCHGHKDALLVLHEAERGVQIYRGGRLES